MVKASKSKVKDPVGLEGQYVLYALKEPVWGSLVLPPQKIPSL